MASRIGTAITAAQLHDYFGVQHFSIKDAEGLGVSRTRLVDAVAAGHVTRIRPDSYRATSAVADDGDEVRLICEFVGQAGDHGLPAGAGYETAAAVWGLPAGPLSGARAVGVGSECPLTLVIQDGPGLKFGRRPGIRIRRVSKLPAEHLLLGPNGAMVTTPLRTAIDLARFAGKEWGIGMIVAARRLRIAHLATSTAFDLSAYSPGDVTEWARQADLRAAVHDETAQLIETLARTPRIRAAKGAAVHADPLLESPLESLSWLRLAASSVPMPRLQAWVQDDAGQMRRVDFLWEDEALIGEADGLLKYQDRRDVVAEKLRQEALEGAGYRLVRWTWDDMWTRPEATLARIASTLSRRHLP